MAQLRWLLQVADCIFYLLSVRLRRFYLFVENKLGISVQAFGVLHLCRFSVIFNWFVKVFVQNPALYEYLAEGIQSKGVMVNLSLFIVNIKCLLDVQRPAKSNQVFMRFSHPVLHRFSDDFLMNLRQRLLLWIIYVHYFLFFNNHGNFLYSFFLYDLNFGNFNVFDFHSFPLMRHYRVLWIRVVDHLSNMMFDCVDVDAVFEWYNFVGVTLKFT